MLRSSTQIARLVLVWFALFIGVAVASPIVQAQSIDMVCTSSGVMKLVNTDDGSDSGAVSGHKLDCPLCLPAIIPAPEVKVSLNHLSPLSHVLRPIAAAHIASLTAPPLPSRGPPTSLVWSFYWFGPWGRIVLACSFVQVDWSDGVLYGKNWSLQ